jgi:hypothetical protein
MRLSVPFKTVSASRSRRRRPAHRGSRLVGWTMVALQILVASGLPLPLAGQAPVAGSPAAKRLAGKDRSLPFPCMDKPCGCATAEQCFTSCCCHTPAEMLAWAKANRVDPGMLAALERRAAAGVRPAPKAASCCATTAAQPACCATEAVPVIHEPREASCCSVGSVTPADDVCCDFESLATDPADATEPSSSPVDEEPVPPRRTIVLKAMLACGGIAAGLSAGGVALPPPAIVTCDVALVPVGTTLVADVSADGVRSAPDAPPPRV